MKSALKPLSTLATGLMILALAGCSSGSDSEPPPPAPLPPPGQVDTTPREPEPAVKRLYFVVDQYSQDNPSQPSQTGVYRYNTDKNQATMVSRGGPVELLRPTVALAPDRMNHAFAVLREKNRFWLLEPDGEELTPLSSFNQTICPLPTTNPLRDTGSYLTGVGLAQAGLYVRTPGSDEKCNSPDDQFWAIPLNTPSTTPPQSVHKARALGQALLDKDLQLQGFIHASAGQPIEVLDREGQPVAQVASTANGPVALHHAYEEDRSVLVIGTEVYLVDTRKIQEPDFVLPGSVLTLSSPEMAANIRFDQDALYVIDGPSLKVVRYADPTAFTLLDANAENLTKLSFGNSARPHSQVFTANHVLVLGESSTGRQLFAVNKSSGASATKIADQVTEEYLATERYLYFSTATPPGAGESARALVYEEVDGSLAPTSHQHDHGRWHFYTNANTYRALLIQATNTYQDGFFRNAQLAVYETGQPQTPERKMSSLQNENWGYQVAELGHGEGDHLLLVLKNSQGDRGLFHLNPRGVFTRITLNGELNSISCPRISFDQPSSYCGPL